MKNIKLIALSSICPILLSTPSIFAQNSCQNIIINPLTGKRECFGGNNFNTGDTQNNSNTHKIAISLSGNATLSYSGNSSVERRNNGTKININLRINNQSSKYIRDPIITYSIQEIRRNSGGLIIDTITLYSGETNYNGIILPQDTVVINDNFTVPSLIRRKYSYTKSKIVLAPLTITFSDNDGQVYEQDTR